MSRPIVLTEEIKRKARDDFAAMLNGIKMSDGKLSYSKSFTYKDSSAVVWLTPEAYKKMFALVTEFPEEVGWHGTASRSGREQSAGDNEFTIEDIFVYPQEVTGSAVNTDQAAYTGWLYAFDDDAFNKIRMHGHSHVNMGVSPSSIDEKHKQRILDQLEPDMFYIFMIWNKRLEIHTLIYDMQNNILYEDKDVDVKLLGNEDMDGFLTDARAKVQKNIYKKNKNGSKSQRDEQLGIHGSDEDFEYSSLYGGMNDPYDLGGQAWRR